MRDRFEESNIRLAVEALDLVENGSSEREAVRRLVRNAPRRQILESASLRLVMQTLNERDLLDRMIGHILSEEKRNGTGLAACRVATSIALRWHDRETIRRIGRSVRDLISRSQWRNLQFLVGSLETVDKEDLKVGLSDEARIGLETHQLAWWVSYCFLHFGRSDAIEFLSAPPRLRFIRVNPLRNQGKIGLPKEVNPLKPALIQVASGPPIYKVEGSLTKFSRFFSDGLFQVQDLSSFLAVQAADPKPGETVLDVCAAPGGKTAAIAQGMRNRGRIVSVDYSRGRMRSWKGEMARLGVKIAEPIISDAASIPFEEKFDLILIDPPCTGTGILDRNPRMKWQLTQESVFKYSKIQTAILNSASNFLAENGRILYCTCSVTLEENERVISSFLRTHPEFETRTIGKEFGSQGLEGMSQCRRLWPHRDRSAGYFIARLEHWR